MSNSNDNRPFWRSPEFVLVASMLVTLLAVIWFIFWWSQSLLVLQPPTPGQGGTTTTSKDVMELVLNNRKDLIAIILGAFGAWIGAGAAYFFGRENLREATSSILRMKGATPAEILMQTTVADLKPKPLPKTFKDSDKAADVLKWLQEDPERFFATIVDNLGKVKYVLHEEAIYRLVADTTLPPEKKYDESKSTIESVATFIKEQKSYAESKAWQNLINAAIKVNQRSSCALANEQMGVERKFVAIAVDDKDVPVGYITTGDIRKLLTSIGK